MPTDELAAAYQNIPGYTQHARAAETIRDRLTAARQAKLRPYSEGTPVIEARRLLAEQLVDKAAAGTPLPDDLGTFAWGPEWRASMYYAEQENLFAILTDAAEHADNNLRMHIERNSAPALEHLHNRLQEVLADARSTSQLRDATEAYTAIRQAQKTITINVMNPGPPECRGNIRPTLDLLSVGGEMADQFEQWPRWTTDGSVGSPQYDERPPWPTGQDMNRLDYTTAYLKWAATSSAHFWVPTIPQLKAAAARHQKLDEARLMHAQAVRNGYAPAQRWTIPTELSVAAMLDQLNVKETANV